MPYFEFLDSDKVLALILMPRGCFKFFSAVKEQKCTNRMDLEL